MLTGWRFPRFVHSAALRDDADVAALPVSHLVRLLVSAVAAPLLFLQQREYPTLIWTSRQKKTFFLNHHLALTQATFNLAAGAATWAEAALAKVGRLFLHLQILHQHLQAAAVLLRAVSVELI